ncbi:hypothetical protein [Streptomyces sp. NPDC057877]|uniref:hypothetical protein n=1 Tax=Streptomyces sp. NPDC057877 TaxID=3346269 RepID=UPI0036854DDE
MDAQPSRLTVIPSGIESASDRRLAVEQWLLAALDRPGRARARVEWQTLGLAMMPLGVRYSAVRIPGRLVAALAGVDDPRHLGGALVVDEFLGQVLDGGPVICDTRHGYRYYALVPPSVPATWAAAAEDWRTVDVDVFGRGCLLGVPPVDAVSHPETGPYTSYWAVPMPALGVLCEPLAVARLIAAATHQIGGEQDR